MMMQVIYWPLDLLPSCKVEGEIFAHGQKLADDFWVVFAFEREKCTSAIGKLVFVEGELNGIGNSGASSSKCLSDISLEIEIDLKTLLPIRIYSNGSLLNEPNVVLYSIPRPSLFEFYAFPEVEPIQPASILHATQKQFGSNCVRSQIGFHAIQLINLHFGVMKQSKTESIHLKLGCFKSHLLKNLAIKKNALRQIRSWSVHSVNLAFFLAIDALIGSLVALLISNHLPNLCNSLSAVYSTYFISLYKNLMNWLMGWPAGFKLNNNLNKFLGEMFLCMFSMWEVMFFSSLKVSIDSFAVATAYYSSIAGISSLLAAIQDILRFFTAHLQFMHFVASKIYKFKVFSLFNLLLLFRGMKWNDLRKRYDYANYDTDQLLIGTILFTVLAYLFPTVLVYFLAFSLTAYAIKGTNALLSVFQQLCIHFPYWQWICKFLGRKNSIPYSISFKPVKSEKGKIQFFRLISIPLSCIQILTNHISVAISDCQVQK